MPEPGQYDLCPNCGYIMRDGVCQSCGHKIEVKIDKNNTGSAVKKDIYGDIYTASEPDNGGNNAITIVMAVFTFLMLFVYALVAFSYQNSVLEDIKVPTVSVKADEQKHSGYGYEGRLADYFKTYMSALIGDKEDRLDADAYDYYDKEFYWFDDYVAKDVSYNCVAKEWGFNNVDGWFDEAGGEFPRDLYIYYEYVLPKEVSFDSTELEYYLFDKSADIADLYEGYSHDSFQHECHRETEAIYLSGYVYVTYMDENVLSLLYENTGYFVTDVDTEDEAYYRIMTSLDSVNIDMKTGKILKAEDLFKLDGDFAAELISECNRQNENANLDTIYTVDEVKKIISEGRLLWFYTPIGIEFGVNYPEFEGYCTFSMKDASKILR